MFKGVSFSRKSILSFLSISVLIVLAFSYQNCAGPTADTLGSDDDTQGDLADQPIYKSAPFGFDLTVDQITYMSCTKYLSGTGDPRDIGDKRAYFTLKVGAYGANTGIKLASSFVGYADSHFRPSSGSIDVPDDPNAPAPVDDVKRLLQNSISAGAQLQMSVRGRNNPVNSVVSISGNGTIGTDLANVLSPLTGDEMAGQLAENARTTPMNYFYGNIGSSRNVEGSLYFNTKDESLATDLRNGLANDDILVMGFMKPAEKSTALIPISPPSLSDRMYGIGLKLSFSSAHGVNSYLSARILDQVDEVDTGSTSYTARAAWTCSSDNRYLIVDPSDAFGDPNVDGDGVCPIQSAASRSLEAEINKRKIIERQLPADKWHINTEKKCVVPKVGNCYGRIEVEYDVTKACDKSGTAKDCAHYVSVCTRN